MPLPDGLSYFEPDAPWSNVHENFLHQFKTGSSFIVNHSGSSGREAYLRATKNLGWIIDQAIENEIQMRAIGAGWSFSKVAVCNGGMVQTKSLDLIFKPKSNHLSPIYINSGKTAESLRFVECGVQVARLNTELEINTTPPRCLQASGGSNGQSMAGVISTGTHGAALFTGAVHDSVVGLHLVTGLGKHLWIERQSNPVAGPELLSWLDDAELISNDSVFNSAVVSLGAFGFIHGVMIQTDPLYLLKEYRIENVRYTDELMNAFAALDMASLQSHLPGLPDSGLNHELYHMEINLNPYTVRKGSDEGMYVFLFYKVPVPAEYRVHHSGPHAPAPSPEFMWMMKGLTTRLRGRLGYNIISRMTTEQFEQNIRQATEHPATIGTIFRATRFVGNIASYALAIPTTYIGKAIEIIVDVISKKAFAGAVAVRFVKGTKATMGFTRFENTSVIELDGVDIPNNHAVFLKVIESIENNAIPYTIHWGKMSNPLNSERVKLMYEETRVNEWKGARERVLPTIQQRAVFNNDFMTQCGLDGPLIFPPNV
jgi:hypothetical protein